MDSPRSAADGAASLTAFVTGLPKVDLHLHLVGSASPAVVARLAAQAGDGTVPVEESALREYFRYRDFVHFLDVFKSVLRLIRTPQDLVTLITAMAGDLAAQGVAYAEVTVTPLLHVMGGLSPEEIRDGLNAGARLARQESGVELAWCYEIPVRDEYADAGLRTVRMALETPPDALVSFGLGGAEAGYPRSHFREAFDRVRAAGLKCVPHAGETTEADHVRQAIDHLGAARVGHGIRAVDDPALLDALAARGITLEICLTSNVRTGAAASLADHPLPQLLAAGVDVCLCSDDPPMFDTDLVQEYVSAATALGMSRSRLAELAGRGIRAAFLPDPAKADLLARLDRYAALHAGA